MFGATSNIKIKVDSEDGCLQTISVEWPASKVKESINKAFESVQSQAKVPGFRAGKIPLEIVKERFKEAAYSKAQDALFEEGVSEALKQKKLQPVQPPVIQSANFSPESVFQFAFRVEVMPEVKAAGYKGIKLTKKVNLVTEDDVQKALKSIAEANYKLVESKDETLAETHFAVIDYEGFVDGQPIEGAKAENFLIDMSAPQAIQGLAEGLKGAKTGEERSVSVRFPEDSPAKALAGKEGVFKIKLTAIKTKQLPNLDDDFAKDLGLTSFDELQKRIRENLTMEREQASRKDLERQIVDALLTENKFPIPPSVLAKQLERLLENHRQMLIRQGLPREDQNKSLEQIKPQAQGQAEKDVRLAYLFQSIAAAEKIDATEEEINGEINAIVQRADPKEKPNLEKILNQSYRDRIRYDVREAKLFSWLIEHAKIKETAGGS